jgi:hypothetical protein
MLEVTSNVESQQLQARVIQGEEQGEGVWNKIEDKSNVYEESYL